MLRVIILVALFLLVGILAVVGTEIRERRRKGNPQSSNLQSQECCGQHLVCERESLLSGDDAIEYYDDEDLDAYIGREASSYTSRETDAFEDVFDTLREEDVAGWCRSLQKRGIELPLPVREKALLIVRELRANARV